MPFRSCFNLSNLIVFWLPLVFQKERSPADFYNPDEPDNALSIRNDGDPFRYSGATLPSSLTSDGTSPSNQLLVEKVQPLSMQNQSPSKDSTDNSGLVPSTGSSLLAQSITDEIPGSNAAGAGAAALFTGALGIFLGRAHDVNLLLNDNPTNVHIKKVDGVTHGGGAQGGSASKSGGSAGAATDGSGSDLEILCPPARFSLRTVVWCDLG